MICERGINKSVIGAYTPKICLPSPSQYFFCKHFHMKLKRWSFVGPILRRMNYFFQN